VTMKIPIALKQLMGNSVKICFANSTEIYSCVSVLLPTIQKANFSHVVNLANPTTV